MLRFGSAASRGLRTQSGLFKSSPNYVQFNSNSSLATSSSSSPSASYDWISNNTDFNFNKSRSAEKFVEVLAEIKTRLRRTEVPHAVRPYVFRPKNELILRNMHLYDKEGNIRKPETWIGPPSSKQLMGLLRRVTTQESAAISIEILDRCLKYYPQTVQSKHLVAFVRASACVGNFHKSLEIIQSPQYVRLIDATVVREIIRLFAIRAVTINKDSAYKDMTRILNKFSKYLSGELENHLETQLLMVYGLAPFKDHSYVQPHIEAVKRLLPTAEPVPSSDKLAKHKGAGHSYMDFTLGRLGLSTLPAEVSSGVDVAKLDLLISNVDALLTANKSTFPLERYVKQASLGIQEETERARAKAQPPAVEEEPKAEEEAEAEK